MKLFSVAGAASAFYCNNKAGSAWQASADSRRTFCDYLSTRVDYKVRN